MKYGKCKFLHKENGMMVVEAVLSFTIFVMVVAAIIYLTTIFMLHNRIQFALNSAAHELASYSYVYQALGIRSKSLQIKEDGSKYVEDIDSTATQVVDTLNKVESLKDRAESTDIESLDVSDIQSAWNDVKSTVDSGKASYNKIKNLVTNPKNLLVGVIYMAGDLADTGLKTVFATYAAMGLTQKYLSTDKQTADEYLKSMGVKEGYNGLDFSGSSVFCDESMQLIDLVVEYDIDLSFVKLIIPDAKLHVVQRVTVPAWLDGDCNKKTLSSYGVETQW